MGQMSTRLCGSQVSDAAILRFRQDVINAGHYSRKTTTTLFPAALLATPALRIPMHPAPAALELTLLA